MPRGTLPSDGDGTRAGSTSRSRGSSVCWLRRAARPWPRRRKCYRELEFLLAWPPGRNDPAGHCLQGFIDCLYRDASGGWHVIDYKTNRVAAGQLAAAAADYEMQMLVYGMAVERILGRPPEELTLCFLRPGLEYRFAWDAASRAAGDGVGRRGHRAVVRPRDIELRQAGQGLSSVGVTPTGKAVTAPVRREVAAGRCFMLAFQCFPTNSRSADKGGYAQLRLPAAARLEGTAISAIPC